MAWPVTSSRLAYENPWIRVREDAVTRPDGAPGIFGVVTVKRTAVFVVALTDADEVVLVTIERHTVGETIEVPAGGADEADALLAAQRELLEETGLVATSWQQVGFMTALNGVCEAPELVFLARGLSLAVGVRVDADEGISRVDRVSWPEVMAMIADGRITDGESIAALMFAAVALGRVR